MSRLDMARALAGGAAGTRASEPSSDTTAASMALGEVVESGDGAVQVLIDGSDPDEGEGTWVECDTDEEIAAGTRVTVISSGGVYKAIALTPDSTGAGAAMAEAERAKTAAESAASTASSAVSTANAASSTAQAAQTAATNAGNAAAAAQADAASALAKTKDTAHFWVEQGGEDAPVPAGAYVTALEYSEADPASTLEGGFVRIDSDSLDIGRGGEVLASFDADSVDLLGGDVQLWAVNGQYVLKGSRGGAVVSNAVDLGGMDQGLLYYDDYEVEEQPDGSWAVTGGSSYARVGADEVNVAASRPKGALGALRYGMAKYVCGTGSGTTAVANTGTGYLYLAKYPSSKAIPDNSSGAYPSLFSCTSAGQLTVNEAGVYRVTAQVGFYSSSGTATRRIVMRAVRGAIPSSGYATSWEAVHTNTTTAVFTGTGAGQILFIRDDFVAEFKAGDTLWIGLSSSAANTVVNHPDNWVMMQRVS